jgi:hypothetical protein
MSAGLGRKQTNSTQITLIKSQITRKGIECASRGVECLSCAKCHTILIGVICDLIRVICVILDCFFSCEDRAARDAVRQCLCTRCSNASWRTGRRRSMGPVDLRHVLLGLQVRPVGDEDLTIGLRPHRPRAACREQAANLTPAPLSVRLGEIPAAPRTVRHSAARLPD